MNAPVLAAAILALLAAAPNPLLTLGRIHIVRGEYAAAVEPLERLSESGDTSAGEGRYLLACALLASGDTVEARRVFADYLVGFPDGDRAPDARIGIAEANLLLGRKEEAVEIFRSVLIFHPGTPSEPWVLYRMSEILSELGRMDEAEGFRNRLEESYPASPEAALITEEKEEENAAPIAASPWRYSVQVGAFSVIENARVLVDLLREKGYDAFLINRDRLQRVWIGHYSDPAEARAAAAEISEAEGLGAIVVEH